MSRTVQPSRPSIWAPSAAAFAELKHKQIFDKAWPKGMSRQTWLTAPVSVIKGVGQVAQKQLAADGVLTVRDAVLAKKLWTGSDLPRQAGRALERARGAIRAAAEKYNVPLAERPEQPAPRPFDPGMTTLAYFVDPVTGRGYSR